MAIVNQKFSDIFEIITRKCMLWFSLPFIILIVFLCLVVLAPPLFFIRKFVSFLGKTLRPDLGKILSAHSTLLAVTDEITSKPYFNIVISSRFKGTINIDELKSKLTNEVIGIKKVRGELKNIELKQYPFEWMGYIFWKWDETFDISNHVKYYEQGNNSVTKISLKEIYEIEHELLLKPFPEKRSPWDLTVVRHVESKKAEDDESIIFWRFHHSIGDGFAILKLICLEISDGVAEKYIQQVHFPKLNFSHQLLFYARVLKVPYDIAESFSDCFYKDEWKIPHNQMSKNWISAVSDEICMDDIKEAARGLNSDVTAVIFAAITAAVQQSLKKQNRYIPNYFCTGVPFPLKNHPDKLRNYAGAGIVKLPLRETDPVKCLKKVELSLKKLKKSSYPSVLHSIQTVLGLTCHWLIRFSVNTQKVPCTALGSTFPGPKTKVLLLGNEVVASHFALGPLMGNCSVCFTTFTYNNYCTMRVMMNEKIMKNQAEAKEMTKNFVDELYVLLKCATDTV